jgi:hypothetical protein
VSEVNDSNELLGIVYAAQASTVSVSRGKPVDPVYASSQDKKYDNKTPNAQARTVTRFLFSQALTSRVHT